MRDIKELNNILNKFEINLEEKVFEAVEETTYQLKKNIENRIEIPSSRNPSQFVEYKNSIEYDMKANSGEKEIEGVVFSNLKIVSDDKWNGVPVGAFLEWGTGPLGESTNDYEHGYDYTHHIWDWYTAEQYKATGTYGIKARPHFIPALNDIKPKLMNNLKETLKKSWMK